MNQRLEKILVELDKDFGEGKVNCAEAVLLGVCRYFGWASDCIPRIATPFGGGLGGSQHICGALTGGVMALGMRYGREVGGDKQPAYQRTKDLVSWFQREWGALDCRTLLGLDISDPANAEAFRGPGGKHDMVCKRIVPAVCSHLVEEMERDTGA